MPRRLVLSALLAVSLHGPVRADEVVVFAAASLKTALDVVAADFEAATGATVTISYAGSNALAKQIVEGAPADIFISSSVPWMDEVEKAGLIANDARKDLLGNTLVLVAHGDDAPKADIGRGFDLPGLLGDGRLSMAMVDAVPAGQYGKEALQTLGIWDAVEGRVVQTENVRTALALVALGETPFGIVYASDAVAETAVSVVGVFPEGSHAPIVYPAALLSNATDPADVAFFRTLSDGAADMTFAGQGFVVLN